MADRRAAFDGFLERAGLREHADALWPFACTCLVARPKLPEGAGGLGASRLGGTPDLPPSIAWPTHEGARMVFVAQLDLSSLSPGWIDDLPARGWLYLFVATLAPAWDLVHAVRYFDGDRDALRPTVAPSGPHAPAEQPASYAPHQLFFDPTFSLPATRAEEALGLEEFTLESLENAEGTSLGGHPPSWSGKSPGYAAHLCKSGLGAIVHRTHFDSVEALARDLRRQGTKSPETLAQSQEQLARFLADRAGHEAAMGRWHRLFTVRSHRGANMQWWDAGSLQLVIHADDLRARRFDRTHLTVLSS